MVEVTVDVFSISQFSFHLDDVGAKVIRIKPAMRDSEVDLFDCKCLRRDLRTLKMQKNGSLSRTGHVECLPVTSKE